MAFCFQFQNVVVDRFTMTKERTKNLTKPVYHPPSKRTGKKSIPTITPNGPNGSKIFMSISLPKDTLANKQLTSLKKTLYQQTAQPAGPAAPAQTNPSRSALENTIKGQQSRKQEDFNLLDNTGKSVTLSPRKPSVSREISQTLIKRKSSGASGGTMLSSISLGKRVEVSIPTAGDLRSITSSNSFTCSDDETLSRSCDLDDVASESSEAMNAPIPPTPEPEKEKTGEMRERVHRHLLQTLSDTDQFLRAMDQKRRNRAPQIVYSDDEEIVDNTNSNDRCAGNNNKEESDVGRNAHASAGAAHASAGAAHASAGAAHAHSLLKQGVDPLYIHIEQFEDTVIDGLSDIELSLPNSTQKVTASQQYLDLVHLLEKGSPKPEENTAATNE